jgi:hypothetical protein
LLGSVRRRSQWIFCASNSWVEVEVGRMIQRKILPIVSGVTGEEERVARN